MKRGSGLKRGKPLLAKGGISSSVGIKSGVGLKSGKRIRTASSRSSSVIKKDEEVYEEVWNSHPHECAECGMPLGEEFRDEEGRVIDRFRFSHILGKKAFPEFRHDKRNFNLMDLKHHMQWEHGDKENMKVYEGNMRIIKELTDGGR